MIEFMGFVRNIDDANAMLGTGTWAQNHPHIESVARIQRDPARRWRGGSTSCDFHNAS